MHLRGNQAPLAFYSLRVVTEQDEWLQKSHRVKLWSRAGHFPALQLEWLAVHRPMQKRRIGTIIMGRVLDQFISAIETYGIPALTCTAINRDIGSFYRALGFVEYGPPDQTMPKMMLAAQSAWELKTLRDNV